jgi:hypothetical protein
MKTLLNIPTILASALVLLVTGAPVHALTQSSSFRCTLKVQDLVGRDLIDQSDVRVSSPAKESDFIEIFDGGMKQKIREATVSNSEIFLNTRWVKMANTMIPELSLGIYRTNRLVANRRSIVAEARGDARAAVHVTGFTPNGSRIEVGCQPD